MTPRQQLESAVSHHLAGRLTEAEALYRQALAQQPDLAEAHNNLGLLLAARGELDEAIARHRRAIEIAPGLAEAHNNLTLALNAKGQFDEAAAAARQAVQINPNFTEAHLNLGNALQGQGKLDEAIACFRHAIGLRPDLAEAHANLGSVLKSVGRLDEAIASYRHAIRLKPDLAEAHFNLGIALKVNSQHDDAITSYRQAIRLKPDYIEAHINLGNTLGDIAQNEDAIASYRRILQIKPDHVVAHSNLAFALNYQSDLDPGEILAEHRAWNDRHARPLLSEIIPHANDRSPDRKLRIGYVSADFRWHAVGLFFTPLLEHHDRKRVEVFCYSNTTNSDDRTERIKRSCHAWRNVSELSDDALAKLIHSDQIDILVDLSLHSAGNRLLTFARKPAPIQATWLGYAGTTGLTTMDYRFTDPFLDPPGTDPFYCEKSVRLPHTFWCYEPVQQTPQVNFLPALEAGDITFGSFNNFAKVTAPTQELWAKILSGIPHSRMVIYAPPGNHQTRVIERFSQAGIDANRVEFAGRKPMTEYLLQFHRVDIALDPFPCGGGTTTCDAIWMGVPIVTLRGRTAVGRGGVSILSNVGLTDWIAETPEQYVSIAKEMAGDLPRLASLRSGLRKRMEQSPLMDGARFAADVEAAYRQMWRNWCAASK